MGTRRSVRLAAVAAAGLLAGLLPGTDSASGGQDGRLSLDYTCGFPGGNRSVTVELQQAYPGGASAGTAFRPGQLTVRVPLPADLAGAAAGAGEVVAASGTAALTTAIGQGATSVRADWTALAASTTPLPGDGDGLLAFTGTVPAVTVAAPGEVTFTAGALALDLTVQRVANAAAPTPTPSSPTASAPAANVAAASAPAAKAASAGAARIAVACVPVAGQAAELGRVVVAEGPAGSAVPSAPAPGGSGPARPPGGAAGGGTPTGTAAPGGSASASGSPTPSGPSASAGLTVPGAAARGAAAIRVQAGYHSGTNQCPEPPEGALDAGRLPPVPEGAMVLPDPEYPFPSVPACAYADGFANVAKLGQATLVNDPAKSPALVGLNLTRRLVMLWGDTDGYFEADSLGELKLPVAESTFLTYGFVPTTAKIEFTPLGLLTIVATGNANWNQPSLFTIGGHQSMRIYDVKVNGTPLDVGPDCRTAEPVDLVLKGRQDGYLPDGGDGKPDYTLQGGGPLAQTDLYVPPFTGCGSHGEDLDALFTAAVSGPGNSLNLMQGPICTPTSDQPNGCEPEIVIPDPPTRRR
ncbi:hypothetical protein GCM10023235_07550 [Kitasatospora terrestris]|uniref:DUF6801 domain-containing protein n=1 Tax=Kitasatospora terrestris TaxID=258051 RepID=A0ABP9DAW1_9ACTN